MIALALGLLAAVDAPSASGAGERTVPPAPQLPACRSDRPARMVATLRGLPEPIRAEITRFFAGDDGIADAGAMYNPTDYIADRGVPRRRFIRAYLTQDVWLIWFEQGGFVSGVNAIALTRQADGSDATIAYRATSGSWFKSDSCAGSRAFLTGARSAR